MYIGRHICRYHQYFFRSLRSKNFYGGILCSDESFIAWACLLEWIRLSHLLRKRDSSLQGSDSSSKRSGVQLSNCSIRSVWFAPTQTFSAIESLQLSLSQKWYIFEAALHASWRRALAEVLARIQRFCCILRSDPSELCFPGMWDRAGYEARSTSNSLKNEDPYLPFSLPHMGITRRDVECLFNS